VLYPYELILPLGGNGGLSSLGGGGGGCDVNGNGGAC
jgi:hypothetical protein